LYDPSGFEDDVFVQTVRGRGRGRGFKIESARSIFDLERTSMIHGALEKLTDRVLQILQILLDNDAISRPGFFERLGHSELCELPSDVLHFLNIVEELLYDYADESVQQAAHELRHKVVRASLP
jgi:hypothetical protein